MSFFDALPDEPPCPPTPPRGRMPGWSGPPEDVLPGVVALELALVRTERQVMWIGGAEVYPEGMGFSVLMCGRGAARPGVESGPGTWQFGVQFSDGQKATVHGVGMLSSVLPARGVSTTVSGISGGRPSEPPDGPVLRACGGGGSRSSWRQQYWLWPLPTPGDVLFACEWPDLEIDFTTATVSANVFLEAAGRARDMWPGQPPAELPNP
jgi:hypothetical protein